MTTDRLDGIVYQQQEQSSKKEPIILSQQFEKILSAAVAVVNKEGIASLTIDAVAAKVGLSKGGVLHHFHTKESLIKAMVQRTADFWRASFFEAVEQEAEGPARATKALMKLCLTDAKMWTSEMKNMSSAMFAALAFDPKLIAPTRKVYKEIVQRLDEDDLPPGVAITVLAALDGVWMWWVFGFAKIDQELCDRIQKPLEEFLEGL